MWRTAPSRCGRRLVSEAGRLVGVEGGLVGVGGGLLVGVGGGLLVGVEGGAASRWSRRRCGRRTSQRGRRAGA